MKYATFWQRFWAMWVDVLVFLPWFFADAWFGGESKVWGVAFAIPVGLWVPAYEIYCHGKHGRTLGKYVTGIRVVRITGNAIGWREAWLRSSVGCVFGALYIAGTFIALAASPSVDFPAPDWMTRTERLMKYEPAWLAWANPAAQIWGLSEVVVMLFNKQRRALHDFVAGTVVTRGDSRGVGETVEGEPTVQG